MVFSSLTVPKQVSESAQSTIKALDAAIDNKTADKPVEQDLNISVASAAIDYEAADTTNVEADLNMTSGSEESSFVSFAPPNKDYSKKNLSDEKVILNHTTGSP